MKKFFIICSVLIILVILIFVTLIAYIYYQANQDTKVKSDAILVLGGSAIAGTSCYGPICKQIGFTPHPHYNPCLVARVDHAISLYKTGFASKILMSGGTDPDNVNEAETMKKIAIDAGVPESDILVEKESTSTYENFLLSKKVLAESGLNTIIIVTEPYHIARAELVASKLHYTYSTSPAADSACWNKADFFDNWNFIKRESLALIAYKFLNEI